MKKLALLLLVFFVSMYADDDPKTGDELVEVKLVSEYENLYAGMEQWIGVLMTMEEGWHVYWRYAGDSGLPTMVDWTSKDKNVEISEIKWVTPHKIKFSGMATYGYEGEVLLMMKIKVPKDFEKNKLNLKANVNYLVCKSKCLPGNAQVSLDLSVRNSPSLPTQYKTKFEKYAKMLPLENEYFDLSARLKGGDLIIEMKEMKYVDYNKVSFYPYEADIISNGEDQVFEKNDGEASLKIPLAKYRVQDPKMLKGILVFDKNIKNETNAIEIKVPVKERSR